MDDAAWESLARVLGPDGTPVGVAFAFGRPGVLLTVRSLAPDGAELVLQPRNGTTFRAAVGAYDEDLIGAEGGGLLPLVAGTRTEALTETPVAVWLPATLLTPGVALPALASEEGDRLSVRITGDFPAYPLTGAPVLTEDGVVGILLDGTPTEGWLRGRLLRRVPRDITTLIARPRTSVQPRRGKWIRVTGTYRPDPQAATLAELVGRMLAEGGFGLLHGGSTGIDQIVHDSFVAVSAAPAPVQAIAAPGWGMHFAPAAGEPVLGLDVEVDPVTFAGDALVVFGGGVGTADVIRRTRSAGRPILPVVPSGTAAVEVAQLMLASWDTLGLPEVGLERFQALTAAGADRVVARLMEVLDVLFPPGEPAATARQSMRMVDPTAVNDSAAGEADLLDVSADVERFAKLIAAADLAPPLAIGLFGEWGSGKSFFIERLHARLGALCPIGGPAAAETCGDICQIRFNAWHYADGNLWGALGAHVFDGLAAALALTPDDVAKERAKLQASLEWVTKERKKAEQALQEAKAGVEQATAQVEAKEAEQKAAAESYRVWLTTSAWRKVAAQPETREAITALEGIAGRLGLSAAYSEARDAGRGFSELGAEARSVAGAIRGLWRPRGPLEWGIILCLLIAAGVSVVPGDWFPGADFGAKVTQVVAGIGYAIKRISSWLRDTGQIVARARDLDQRAQHAAEELRAEGTPETRAARSHLSKAEAELDVAKRKLEDLESSIVRTSAALVQLDPSKLVYDFVEARSRADGAYRQAEGIVSMLRRDLEELGKRLKAAHAEPVASPEARRAVRRVVLYVDDLDRCPPSQVVAVLQAVHLLLAFDLFVVVVAVDPRWLERALDDHYRAIFRAEATTAADLSAHDYLEKIFQIPFTLAPVDDRGFAKLIEANLPFEEQLPALQKGPDTKAEKASDVTPSPLDGASSMGGSGGRIDRPVRAEEAVSLPDGGASTGSEGPPASAAAQPETSSSPSAPPVDIVRRFIIERREQEAILLLHPFIGTPRATKRFINVYRLLRASVPEADFQAFVATEHQVVQVLLAVTIGHPRAGALFLRELLTQPHPARESWTDLLARFEGRPFEARAEEIDRARLLYGLRRLERLPADAGLYRKWARSVGRFSFLWSWDPLPPPLPVGRYRRRTDVRQRPVPPLGIPPETADA